MQTVYTYARLPRFVSLQINLKKFLWRKLLFLRQPTFAKQKKMKFLIRTGVFLGCFEKLKKKENLQTSVSSRDKKETKILGNMHSREFSKPIWPQSNNLQTKLIQSSFTKIARICFGCQLWWFGFVWTKNFALQLWLFPQHQIFFEQSCVTRAFILSQTISKKHHQRLICG